MHATRAEQNRVRDLSAGLVAQHEQALTEWRLAVEGGELDAPKPAPPPELEPLSLRNLALQRRLDQLSERRREVLTGMRDDVVCDASARWSAVAQERRALAERDGLLDRAQRELVAAVLDVDHVRRHPSWEREWTGTEPSPPWGGPQVSRVQVDRDRPRKPNKLPTASRL